mmetsp:Transcript_89859/g.262640  ORF Transcript_89859/g.262640 Transcript_89859/m.262640 type:complete len:367 (+) Transcript_89859:303-1403(+)
MARHLLGAAAAARRRHAGGAARPQGVAAWAREVRLRRLPRGLARSAGAQAASCWRLVLRACAGAAEAKEKPGPHSRVIKVFVRHYLQAVTRDSSLLIPLPERVGPHAAPVNRLPAALREALQPPSAVPRREPRHRSGTRLGAAGALHPGVVHVRLAPRARPLRRLLHDADAEAPSGAPGRPGGEPEGDDACAPWLPGRALEPQAPQLRGPGAGHARVRRQQRRERCQDDVLRPVCRLAPLLGRALAPAAAPASAAALRERRQDVDGVGRGDGPGQGCLQSRRGVRQHWGRSPCRRAWSGVGRGRRLRPCGGPSPRRSSRRCRGRCLCPCHRQSSCRFARPSNSGWHRHRRGCGGGLGHRSYGRLVH